MTNHANALSFLERGRNRRSHRRIGHNTWVVPCSVNGDDGVGIRLHHTVVVAYLPDGRVVLNSGGWRTVTTKDRINRFTSASITSVRGDWFVGSHRLGCKPPKISTCRSCKGSGEQRFVVKGTWTYDPGVDRTVWTPFDRPVVKQHSCSYCSGTGERDYGSTPVYPSFEDGVVLDTSGAVIGVGGLPVDQGGRTPPRSRYPQDYYGFNVAPLPPSAAETLIDRSTCRNCETPIEQVPGDGRWEHSHEAPIGSRCWHGDAGPEPYLGPPMRLAEGDLDRRAEIPSTITTLPTETTGDAMRWKPADADAELASWVELLRELRGES